MNRKVSATSPAAPSVSSDGAAMNMADTNARPLRAGRYMIFSDQDLTALKHNLVGNALISTVFVGLLATISNPHIPILMRMVLVAICVSGLHASTIAAWNIIESCIQLHPHLQPHWLFTKVVERPLVTAILSGVVTFMIVKLAGPLTITVSQSAAIIQSSIGR